MFFYLIRPWVRWKINVLLDDNKRPGVVLQWVLKKDKISWQYYQDMLRLEIQLREKKSAPGEGIFTEKSSDHVYGQLFVQQSFTGEYRADSHHSDPIIAPADSMIARRHTSHSKYRKTHVISVSLALLLLVTGALFFRNVFDKKDLSQNISRPVSLRPPIDDLPSPQGKELILLTEQVVPSGVREILRPAFGPIKETYDSGKEQLLEDLSSLPIQPWVDLSRQLYSANFTEKNNGDISQGIMPEGFLENVPFSRWLNADLFHANRNGEYTLQRQ